MTEKSGFDESQREEPCQVCQTFHSIHKLPCERVLEIQKSPNGEGLTEETMPFLLYCELRGDHGLDVDGLLKRTKLELLKTLACHCRNRDEWHKAADDKDKEIAKLELENERTRNLLAENMCGYCWRKMEDKALAEGGKGE